MWWKGSAPCYHSLSKNCSPDLPRKPSACLDLRVEKSIWGQRLGVESSRFLHDRQTCVIMMRAPDNGRGPDSSLSGQDIRGKLKGQWKVTQSLELASFFMKGIIYWD